jgi:hypothetical protein
MADEIPEYVALSIKDQMVGDTLCFEVAYQRPNQEGVHHHIFPHSLILEKVQQLGLDPTNEDDIEKAMQWILHEPFIEETDAPHPPQVRGFVQRTAPSYEEIADAEIAAARKRVHLNISGISDFRHRMRTAAAVELTQRKEAQR